jgi:hypothetical protein
MWPRYRGLVERLVVDGRLVARAFGVALARTLGAGVAAALGVDRGVAVGPVVGLGRAVALALAVAVGWLDGEARGEAPPTADRATTTTRNATMSTATRTV